MLASSSSALTGSAITAGLSAGASRCLIAHPGNPPYLLRIVELVPSPATAPATVDAAAAVLTRAGMLPVRLRKEVAGFVFNRLQGAVLREAYALVRDGGVAPEDIDLVMRAGLARRWSVLGPFETVELNTRGGIDRHAAIMGPAYARMGAERGQPDVVWASELVSDVSAASVRRRLPRQAWDEHVAWRDRALMVLERCWRAHLELSGPPPAPPTALASSGTEDAISDADMTGTKQSCDLLVIGGGPAGLAAAATAGRHGLRTIVLDERPTPGGQVYKQPGPGFRIREPARIGRDYVRGLALARQASESGADLRAGVEVVALDGARRTAVVDRGRPVLSSAGPAPADRGRSARPAGRLPRLDPARRRYRRRRAGTGEGIARRARQPGRVRRQRAAGARLPGPAAALRRQGGAGPGVRAGAQSPDAAGPRARRGRER